jgi:ABC-type lipoprotein export system ATPase subunit
MVKLRWLQVNKFRSVKPGTRLTFNPGYNVLLGQNGTGKTTLLNLVATAIELNFADFKDEEFDLSYELASNEGTVTISVRNENRTFPSPEGFEGISLQKLRALSPEGVLRSPVLSVTADIFIKQTGLRIKIDIEGKRGSAQRTDEQTPGAPVAFDFSTKENLTTGRALIYGLLHWEHTAAIDPEPSSEIAEILLPSTTKRFDESLEYFNNFGGLYLDLFRESGGPILSYTGNLDPTWLMHERLSMQVRDRWGADRYVLTDTDLQFLKQATQLLDFESAEAIIELKDSGKNEQYEFMHLGNLRFYFIHRGGWKISEKLLSYGQKRMLAFMHYLAISRSAVIADELVNGLHHRWIRACFESLGQRQVFLTSQNPLLLDYLSFQSPEEVLSTFVLCRWEKGPEQMVWENMSQEAAQDFFDSYKVGFQQVGELLQAWLYQNTREARRLCEEQGCKQCPAKIADWEQNRASLDEVPHPKGALCFQDKHNAHLAASGFPARVVFDAEASFTRSVEGLLECDELTTSLERTYAAPDSRTP